MGQRNESAKPRHEREPIPVRFGSASAFGGKVFLPSPTPHKGPERQGHMVQYVCVVRYYCASESAIICSPYSYLRHGTSKLHTIGGGPLCRVMCCMCAECSLSRLFIRKRDFYQATHAERHLLLLPVFTAIVFRCSPSVWCAVIVVSVAYFNAPLTPPHPRVRSGLMKYGN